MIILEKNIGGMNALICNCFEVPTFIILYSYSSWEFGSNAEINICKTLMMKVIAKEK